jgi:hypothetical protein
MSATISLNLALFKDWLKSDYETQVLLLEVKRLQINDYFYFVYSRTFVELNDKSLIGLKKWFIRQWIMNKESNQYRFRAWFATMRLKNILVIVVKNSYLENRNRQLLNISFLALFFKKFSNYLKLFFPFYSKNVVALNKLNLIIEIKNVIRKIFT